jgi:hypothetical protein
LIGNVESQQPLKPVSVKLVVEAPETKILRGELLKLGVVLRKTQYPVIVPRAAGGRVQVRFTALFGLPTTTPAENIEGADSVELLQLDAPMAVRTQ